MKKLPSLAAPLAFVLFTCAPVQSASPTGHRTESTPSGVAAASQALGGGLRTNSNDAGDAKVSVDIIPEPGAAALGLLGIILLLRHRRNG
ncbi:MAG: hypothetical protein EOP87_04535 [Verrucomicrobiaceae bacterium]|nr:MAG: hypothetical protein EOP87_04535 [Verrucomicrobiaceae bacterium]